MSIPIEDFFEDILGKAQHGLGISDAELVDKSGLSQERLSSVKSGNFNEEAVRALAPLLNLDADTLVESGKKAWYPESVKVEGLAMFNTPYPIPGYEEMSVNAFLVWDPTAKEAAAFDTGANATDILRTIEQHALTVKAIFLTHTHSDHIADLARLKTAVDNPSVYVNKREPLPAAKLIDEGDEFNLGNLHVKSLLTHGHSPGGMSFVITGLSRIIAVVGDSLFANSMGGAARAYAQALENNRTKILSLPDDTILCPGHGPITSVAEEKAHNPFYPEFK